MYVEQMGVVVVLLDIQDQNVRIVAQTTPGVLTVHKIANAKTVLYATLQPVNANVDWAGQGRCVTNHVHQDSMGLTAV